MKAHIAAAAAAILALSLVSFTMSAQMDERQPGLYAIVGEESIPLPYTAGTETGGAVGIMGVELGHKQFNYKGITSGVNASGTFVLVVDPKKKLGSITPKKFDYFLKSLSPKDMGIIPLTINEKKQRREYDSGLMIGAFIVGVSTEEKPKAAFEWEQISDNSYKITASGLAPGEYGCVFYIPMMINYYYQGMFGFTIAQ